MRSRKTYTSEQVAAVMRLLRHRKSADRDVQRADRRELRMRYGFWISDFWVGFTDDDFKAKVAEGTFKVVG
ncbi:MAG TPA: hypothetical protein VGU27_09315 [Candidatus Eisenbacteria bacterium]|nr:hypothetical protein [Candidatus Eisenbacteria bacterium]